MKVYLIHEITKALLSEYEVPEIPMELDPPENEKYLFPSVPYMRIAPPETKENEIAIAVNAGKVNEKWEVKPNFSGLNYWLPDGSFGSITEIGILPPEGYLIEPPILPPSRITAGQFYQQLIIDGKDELVYPAIDSIQDPIKRKLIKVRYEKENFFNIDDPDLIMLSGALGYDTPEKIQKFFVDAKKL